MLKDLISQLKHKFDKEANGVSDLSSQQSATQAEAAPALSTDKIKAIVAEITAASTLFEEAGFLMQRLEIEVGITSRIIPRFRQLKQVSEEEETASLERLKDRQMIHFILVSLFKACRMKALLEDTDMDLCAVEIDISAAPSVKTIFKRDESLAESVDVTRH